jgi:hypothetical protein
MTAELIEDTPRHQLAAPGLLRPAELVGPRRRG